MTDAAVPDFAEADLDDPQDIPPDEGDAGGATADLIQDFEDPNLGPV